MDLKMVGVRVAGPGGHTGFIICVIIINIIINIIDIIIFVVVVVVVVILAGIRVTLYA